MKGNVFHSISSYALIIIAILYCCSIKLFSGKSILRLVTAFLVDLLPPCNPIVDIMPLAAPRGVLKRKKEQCPFPTLCNSSKAYKNKKIFLFVWA